MKLKYIVEIHNHDKTNFGKAIDQQIMEFPSFEAAYEKLLDCGDYDYAELEVWNYEELIAVVSGGKHK